MLHLLFPNGLGTCGVGCPLNVVFMRGWDLGMRDLGMRDATEAYCVKQSQQALFIRSTRVNLIVHNHDLNNNANYS